MATGDASDFLRRIKALIPNNWFTPGQSPLLDGVLSGFAQVLSFNYAQLAYLRLQTRIATATDGFLDLIANDFFGPRLFRQANQSDSSFRARIVASVLRKRNTRDAVTSIVTQLTGKAPIIFEPTRPLDTGVWDGPGIGWDVTGGWGSNLLPYQSFVTVFRPPGQGVPNIAGWDSPAGAWDTPSQFAWTTAAQLDGLTDADLYAAVDSVRPIGFTIWVAIQ